MKYVIVAIASTSHGYIYQLIAGKYTQAFSLSYQDAINMQRQHEVYHPFHVGKGKVGEHKALMKSLDEINFIISSL